MWHQRRKTKTAESVLLHFEVPFFATTQISAAPGLAMANHPTAYNDILNKCTSLSCTRRFIKGYSSPQVSFYRLSFTGLSCLELYTVSLKYTRPYVKEIIKQMLDEGFYIYFNRVDDFYLPGKSWYGIRHFSHDGVICGYDESDHTYSIAAYDINWVYKLIKISQESFFEGLDSMFEQKSYSELCAYKAKDEEVKLDEKMILKHLKEYLFFDKEKFDVKENGKVYGIAVHDFLAMYIEKLKDGKIPHEKMDWRSLRPIWEHKRCMLDRIIAIEKLKNWDDTFSIAYRPLVEYADRIRMMYAMYHKTARASILTGIERGLLELKEREREILTKFVEKMEEQQ